MERIHRGVMNSKKLKFGIGIGIILAVVAWEAISGFEQSKTYYVTVSELTRGRTTRHRIRVGGTIVPGSIERRGGALTFRLAQDADSLPVTYVGSDTLPDTFKDGAQAIIDGEYLAGGFRADKVQAKCASKYEAAPGRAGPTKGPVAALDGAR
jgi:cytochrome c-type biogenesis protein CcmE